ncbi:MAG: Ku protein [Bacillota bacterium]|nr:Ku protein [Bacillota bacterium]
MHALWKGTISFGLVSIPIKLYPATRHRDVRFTLLHRKCHTPLRYQRFCPECGTEVAKEEIVRGYEHQPGRYLVLTEEDLAGLPAAAAQTVEILDFVDLAEIDPVYFEKSYYLEPQPGGGRAYALLRRAMQESGKVGLARVALRAKEALAAVRVFGPGLILNTMFSHDEVLPMSELAGLAELPDEAALDEKEVQMAITLIDHLTAPFTPEKYENPAEEALHRLIQQRLEGEPAVPPPRRREAAEVIDLMTALKESVARTKLRDREQAPPGAVAGAGARRAKAGEPSPPRRAKRKGGR